jgi:hydroxymethylpyrimidine pyrophosphatase-like HAD family hydrolase
VRREVIAATGKPRIVVEPWDRDDPLATDEEARAARLQAIVDDVRAHVPRAILSDDNWLRRYDVAFDVGETQLLGRDEIDAIVASITANDARALVSSVHAHVVLGDWDKGRAIVRIARSLFGDDVTTEPARLRWIFVGDSQNDEAGFAALPLSVGVANVSAVADRLASPPAYITPSPGGHGFAELVELLLAARARG